MRLFALTFSAATLIFGVLMLPACVEEERTAVARPGTTTVVTSQPRPIVDGAPAPQSPTPPIVNNVIEPPAASTVNVAPPAYGATEAQPDERTQATQMVALATQQIERLQRIQALSSDARREDLGASIRNLEGKRGRVLQDLRELEMRPVGRSADIQMQLATDAANLQAAVRASQVTAPPPSQGLPQPSPLAPSQLR
jgi:hypothetical protein